MREWRHLLFAIRLLIIDIGPVALLTMLRLKEATTKMPTTSTERARKLPRREKHNLQGSPHPSPQGRFEVVIAPQRFSPSAGRISAVLLSIAGIAFAHLASAAPLDTTAQALDLITQTADRICNVVSTKGEAESSDVKGQVQAQLSGLAAKLANVGVSGTGSINNEQYQNVLRHDLASTLHDNAECKLKVFQTLEAKLLPETIQTPPPR